jgi:hypothetical protein
MNVAEGGPDAGAPASIISGINRIIHELVNPRVQPGVPASAEQLMAQAKATKVLLQGAEGVLAGDERLTAYAEEVQDTLPDGEEVTLGDMQFAACSYAGESLLHIHSSYSLVDIQ